MAINDTLLIFTPQSNQPPAAAFGTLDTRNGHLVIDLDAGTDESAIFPGVLPRHYAGNSITVRIAWMASSATSGNVVWSVAWERHDDEGTDLDADSFATAQTATGAAPGTSGMVQYTDIAFTSSQVDGLVAGESFRLRITRDADNGSDTMTGDAELIRVECRESA